MNVAVIVGNLGKDPELKTSSGGKSYCTFTLATSDGWGDNKKTNWHNVTVFGKQAESCAQFLKKGSKAGVKGRIENSSWEKDGERKYMTKIIADSVTFLSSKGEGQGQAGHGGGAPTAPGNQSHDVAQQVHGDDDIPF
jgi:single-strand DNA-binding protein